MESSIRVSNLSPSDTWFHIKVTRASSLSQVSQTNEKELGVIMPNVITFLNTFVLPGT